MSETKERRQRKRQERTVTQERQDMEEMLRSPAGMRLLWRVLSTCGIYRSTYSTDSSAAAFSEGRRSVGLEIMTMISDADPGGYLKLLDLANRQEHNEALERKADTNVADPDGIAEE